jgi:FkbM family methyltransferase
MSWIEHKLKLQTRWKSYRSLVSDLGLVPGLKYLIQQRLDHGSHPVVWTHPRQLIHPIGVRHGTSDLSVFRQVFVKNEYGCLDDLPDVGLVLDCGANVGYSAAYFLSRFPTCKVVAVEPDPGNFAALTRNLAPYGDRVTSIQAGVWSHTTGLVLAAETFRDGGEWARQVRPCKPGEAADFRGVDVGTLLADSGYDRISLLKMDIEGAEAVAFSENWQPWLGRVDAIAIELHDDSSFGPATDVFHRAIAGQGFDVTHCGERTVCRRPNRICVSIPTPMADTVPASR